MMILRFAWDKSELWETTLVIKTKHTVAIALRIFLNFLPNVFVGLFLKRVRERRQPLPEVEESQSHLLTPKT
jgi:hypothetical protein